MGKVQRENKEIPVGTTFFGPIQTGPVFHPAFYTMGTGSSPGVKWLGRGVNHQPLLAATLKKE
jgi:hypothetical protein